MVKLDEIGYNQPCLSQGPKVKSNHLQMKLIDNVILLIIWYGLYRPKKSLHFVRRNPGANLHIGFNPEIGLHLHRSVKRKWAMLRSNPPGIALPVKHLNPL